MRPPKLHINCFHHKIHSFHFFGATGFICGTLLGMIVAEALHLNPYIILLLSATGAATFFILAFAAKQITGGETIVYYHHEIAIMIFCTGLLYFLKLPILRYLDITLLGIGVFLALGRIGCYSVGCCHGRPHKHGVKYGQQHVDAGFTWYYKDIPLLPVQLIESAYVFATVIVGTVLLLNHVTPGTLLVCYTVIYGLMRYLLEFFRGDPERPQWYGLSEAQWTTLVLVAASFGMSKIGWLPQYNWHLAILIIIALISIIVTLHSRVKIKYILFSPPHIKQIAEGLDVLEDRNIAASADNNKTVNIYTTKAGLCLSCGKYNKEDTITEYYTISLKDTSALSRKSADKIANLIVLLKKWPRSFDVIEKQNGVYHILFTQNIIVNNNMK